MSLLTIQETLSLLVCPRCRGPLTRLHGVIACGDAACPLGGHPGFGELGGRPVLLDPEWSTSCAAPDGSGPARPRPADQRAPRARWLRRLFAPYNRVAADRAARLLSRLRACEHRPRLLICGHSAYPRILDFERFAAIGRQVGALVLADIAHIAGLVVAGVHPSPVPHVDVVTTTTHKSLRGPRGGMILCRAQYAEAIDKAVFPGLQGGPHNHTTAAIAVALREAATEEFRRYAARIVENAQVLAAALQKQGFRVLTGGTQNHLVVVDATSMGVTGRQLAKAMDAAGMVCNFNRIPFDTQPALHPSGVRLGTPATTSRGFGPEQMARIAAWMAQVARVRADEGQDLEARKQAYRQIAGQVKALCDGFPAPGLL